MLHAGFSLLGSRLLYAGVRIGAWASANLVESAVKLAQMQVDLFNVPPGASVEELDAVIARHLPV